MNYEYSKAIGRNINVIRRSKGLTQEQLSAKLQVVGCDITRSALAKIEVGQRHLYPDELKALKIVFGIPYDDLFV
ncbi:MAG: helix-turn-helix transcriptional regulator [Clostridiales bacterium]|nr:helix-turn-helix transcriptional regulator [Clostridiales bacterium]